MGLLGCPASFQRLIGMAMNGIINVSVYIHDTLLYSRNYFKHTEQLEKLFDKLRNAGLMVNLAKCDFGATNVNYLSFILTPEGILPGLDKLRAARDSKPSSIIQ
jgi:hypothetical protein